MAAGEAFPIRDLGLGEVGLVDGVMLEVVGVPRFSAGGAVDIHIRRRVRGFHWSLAATGDRVPLPRAIPHRQKLFGRCKG